MVFDQVLTDTALYADVVLPATTFLEHYDFAKGYGPMTLQLGTPVIDPVGESRSNTDVFMDLVRRLDLSRDGDPDDELEAMLDVAGGPARSDRRRTARALDARRRRTADGRCSSSTCFRRRPTRKVAPVPGGRSTREAPLGLYGFQPDPATERYPLALISPASERTISSTLGELSRPDGDRSRCIPADAAVARTSTMATRCGCSTIWARCD